MKVFDLKEMEPEEKAEVFYNADEFKARLIDLQAGGQIPTCEMNLYVLFYVIDGEVKVTVNGEEKKLDDGNCLVTEPATLSMKTEEGAEILGIQISKR
ncbi:hypothetical protein AKJ51_03795 [candidate division MSBL1 archaeon SCGC-AAA382A20]|uniref:Cupin 2 conserved barrel domain-containing protein n=1 Tax=candidate division MSBL1 archaeon SCGC-AAA382A20 TaxID=1698280 RepID=A0A133VIU2_9EURY|nr:hypothetical protein AKJ51_03795 [candidate division MSBL1 archaeon SCGC-AAA382A20]